MRKLARIAVLAGLGLSLSGCIAAVAAIPVLAGGGVIGSRVADSGNERLEPTTMPRPPFERVSGAPVIMAEPAPLAETTPEVSPASSAAPAAMPVITPVVAPESELAAATARPPMQTAPSAAAPIAEPISPPGAIAPVELTLPDGSRVAISGAAATGSAASAATVAPVQASSPQGPLDTGAYEDLFTYTLGRAGTRGVGDKRNSALLAAPGALEPVTIPCALSQPAMVIDLDPGDTPLDTAASYAPNPELAQVLARLRLENVSVHWLSGNSAAEAGAVRRLLSETGLDPEGRDELVLMRYPDDRKQTRRRAVGATHCLVAIAGEERRDFDELFAFLKNPDSAAALQPLYGSGWFLVPPALQPVDR